MYNPGTIIYFDPFFFKDGGSKKKYFLVLKNIENKVVICTLPSSVPHIPEDMKGKHGCADHPQSGICCYILLAGKVITKNNFYFDVETYLHGHWIDEYPLDILKETYQIEGLEYEIIGELVPEEFEKIIECFKNSSIVKRKYKRML